MQASQLLEAIKVSAAQEAAGGSVETKQGAV